jgi:hypothetical protein
MKPVPRQDSSSEELPSSVSSLILNTTPKASRSRRRHSTLASVSSLPNLTFGGGERREAERKGRGGGGGDLADILGAQDHEHEHQRLVAPVDHTSLPDLLEKL